MNPAQARQRTLDRLRARIRRARGDWERLQSLTAVAARHEELERLLDDLERQVGRVHDAAVITLVGATGAGKSTLLNALVGAPLARAGDDRPTTREPVIYAPADAELDDLLADLPGGEPKVVRYEPRNSGPWTEQVLVDAPDINSVAGEHREVVRALADKSDVLVVVLHHQSVSEDASVRFLDDFAERRHLLFVLNRADELADGPRADLLAQIHDLARERWKIEHPRVLATSALAAGTQPQTPGWSELCTELHELVTRGTLGSVRRHNAHGTARRISETFREIDAEVGEELAALPDRVEAGMQRVVEFTADEVRARLELRRTDFAHLLYNEVAGRWDGPGGAALRTGGLGTLGLGAGAMLARRNPALAAGAALGGMAVSRVRDSVRRRALEESSNLLPTPGEFAREVHAELAEARLSAGRLAGGSAATLPVPDAARAREASENVLADEWNVVVARDLPDLGRRCSAAWIRWPIDLPVYALAGWVVYRAGEGFVTESYLGMDFLINALLILLAYLFTARFLVRRVLYLRGAKLLEGILGRVTKSLGGLRFDARREIDTEVDELRACMQRMTSVELAFGNESEAS